MFAVSCRILNMKGRPHSSGANRSAESKLPKTRSVYEFGEFHLDSNSKVLRAEMIRFDSL